QPFAQFIVKRPNHTADAVLPDFRRMAKVLAAERGDGVADTVAFDDPVETAAGICALVISPGHQLLDVLIPPGLGPRQSRGNGLGFAQHPVIRPGSGDVARVQIKLADVPSCVAYSVFVGLVDTRRQVLRWSRGYR